MRTIVVLYDKDHDKEKPPTFECGSNDPGIYFYPSTNKERLGEILRIANEGWIVLIHGADQFEKWVSKVRNRGARVIDYSSGDPSHEPMWRDIRTAKDCRELAERLEYWIRHYTIDPIRRIKHRAMNLFAPLDTDCQYLLELWERKDYDAARRHLEDIQKDWQGDPPYSHSPLSKLARLWYMLVGNKMKWPYEVTELRFWANVSIHKPDKVVSLPANKCLYDWLDKVGKANSIDKVVAASIDDANSQSSQANSVSKAEKTALLKKCSSSQDPQFEPCANAGIYQFAVELQKRLIQGSLPELRRDTPMQGFEDCSTVEANFRKFREWLRDLNEAFEALVEEFGGQITVQAGEQQP